VTYFDQNSQVHTSKFDERFFFSEDVLKQENGECVICFENLSIGRPEPLPAQEHGIYMSSKFA